MKKRTLMMALAIAAALLIATTGTLAYLTDTDSDVNVMTLGNVDIEQHEMKRADGVPYNQQETKLGDLVEFEDGIKLFPAFPDPDAENPYTAAGEEGDGFHWGPYVHTGTAWNGLWNDEKIAGVVDKMVFVENTGSSDAYFRTLIAYECPEGIEIGEPADGAQIMINESSTTVYNALTDRFVDYITVDEQRYALVEYVYQDALEPGEWSHPSLLQVLMTHHATNEDVALLGETYEILVVSQAVQTTNFPDAETALNAAFGEVSVDSHPWMSEENGGQPPYESEPSIPVLVSNEEELKEAIANGESVILNDDMILENETLTIAKGNNVVINMAGHTIEGRSTSSTTSKQIEVVNGAKLTIAGSGTITFTATEPDVDWGENGPKPFPGYANNTIVNRGELVVDGATLINNTAPGGASYVIDNYDGGTTTINSGVIHQTNGNVAIRQFASSATNENKVIINGGTVEGKRAVWVQLASSNAAVAPKVTLTVNGGELVSDDTAGDWLSIYSYSYGNSFTSTNITFNGGVMDGNVHFGGGAKADQENVVLNGGTFNGELGRWTNDGFVDIAKP